MKPRKNDQRRGVLLLIVLSILVLLMLLGLTFLVAASQYQRRAKSSVRQALTGTPPKKLLNGAMYQLLRGPNHSSSPLHRHSLLEDLYGRETAKGKVTGVRADLRGQFVKLTFTALPGKPFGRYDGLHNGAVLTMITGAARGSSTRVTGYHAQGRAENGTILVEAFDAGSPPAIGDMFVINDHPFNGTGIGYNPATGKLDLADAAGRPVALLPNFSTLPNENLLARIAVGGVDESWDAADYQNMFLAWVPGTLSSPRADVIPSFHRPALINYWMNKPEWEHVGFRRQVLLRPMPYPGEHPLFSGSNPWFGADDESLLNGPWDVDNDGDGIPDSIWLDLGFPATSAPDGRLYKPLFAILCVDLDGRLNLNAHGNLAQLEATFSAPWPTGGMTAGGDSSMDLPRGQGYGPAEVNLSQLFPGAEYRRLLLGRYGRDGVPGRNGDELISQLKSVGVPFDYANLNAPTAYAQRPDLWGRGLTALDHTGHPLVVMAGQNGETVDDPYELNLVQPDGTDTTYTLEELESLLRVDSVYVSHRNRLMALTTQSARRIVTTSSFDVPAPNALATPEQRRFGSRPERHLIDLMAQRLAAGGVAPSRIQQQLKLMLAFEFRQGQKMDVNRLWGNGQDDRGNGIVDEPSEVGSNSETIFDSVNSVRPDFLNDYPGADNQAHARQIFARHLYCLMMLLVDREFVSPVKQIHPLTLVQRRELTARRIAQWAVNVVDYRDTDAIMTPFEYDVDPFNSNGWDVRIDGNLATAQGGDRRVVWGCEYPDLIITETLAFHDRRVKDTDREGDAPDKDPQKRLKSDAQDQEGDEDLDQIRIPQGSLFIELYCTRSRFHNNPVVPRELYADSRSGNVLLDLGRMSPPHLGQQYPVWRIAISASHHNAADSPGQRALISWDSTSFQPGNMTLLTDVPPQPLEIERIIGFTAQSPPQTVQQGVYYNRVGGSTLLPASSYAVVGPRPVTFIGSQYKDEADESATRTSTQKIELNGSGVSYTNIDGQTAYPTVGSEIQRPLAIIASADPPATWAAPELTAPQGIGVSVTEPLPRRGYYPEPSQELDLPLGTYDPPLDAPLDSDQDALPRRPLSRDELLETGTTPDYKSAFLQRLANPLQPWDPVLNPYITVDWMPIDLTVFNGEDERPEGFPLEVFDPDDPVPESVDESVDDLDPDPVDDPEPEPTNVMFQSRERGQPQSAESNVWSQKTVRPTPSFKQPDAADYFPYELDHTLGYLNSTFAFSGQKTLASVPPPYVGDPASPFPWISWNNRPFVSHLELLLVPASSPSRLLHEFSVASSTSPYDASKPNSYRSPFGHLLNFFHSTDVNRGHQASPKAAHFYRILDYLHVPSRFVGTEKWYNAGHFEDPSQVAARTYRPPFNKLSRFRDPGRININTIADERVWRAVDSGFTPWSEIAASRRGYRTQSLDPRFPTRFANPFRSAASADLMPLPVLERMGVEATVLRSATQTKQKPLFAFDSNRLVNRSGRNAHFYHRAIQRLGNLITTHSNVFAVWITVGYFEVEQHPVDLVHPDGYQLSQELGSDGLGQVNRHRAFYIIDRSVPVAFVAGQNHNVDNAVVLRRFIE